MSFTRVILSKANEDIKEIAFHYSSIKNKLAREFLQKLRSDLFTITNNPTICQVRYGSVVRLSHLNKFPYSVHYTIDDSRKRIVVLAVFSMADNPKKWERRYSQIQSEL